MRKIIGKVKSGYGVAGERLRPMLGLIEERTGLSRLLPNTLNLSIDEPYYVKQDAKLSRAEYDDCEEIYFQRCRVSGIRCLIMRPQTHENGAAHGPAYLEIMSDHHLRTALRLTDNSIVAVDVEGDEEWWKAKNAV